jgi:hypothetical protein
MFAIIGKLNKLSSAKKSFGKVEIVGKLVGI